MDTATLTATVKALHKDWTAFKAANDDGWDYTLRVIFLYKFDMNR